MGDRALEPSNQISEQVPGTEFQFIAKNLKTEQEKIDEYAGRFTKIRERRYWLLWHNKKFREELIKTLADTEEEIPHSLIGAYKRIYAIPKLKHTLWKDFCKRYQVGNNWPEGRVIYHICERPIALEVFQSDDNQRFAKLVIWPETTLEDIKVAWAHLKGSFDEYCEPKIAPWNLKMVNFWRDAGWYEKKVIEKKKPREMAESTDKQYPEVIDKLCLENLIKKYPYLIKKVDPKGKILNSPKYDHNGRINMLLYELGILKIGIARGDFGFPAREYPPVAPGASEELIEGGEYYVRYDIDFSDFELFSEKPDEMSETKESLRADFLIDRQDYITESAEFKSGLKKVIKKAVREMQKRIDSVI